MFIVNNINEIAIPADLDLISFVELYPEHFELNNERELVIDSQIYTILDQNIKYVLGHTTLNNQKYLACLIDSHNETTMLIKFYRLDSKYISFSSYFFLGGFNGIQHFYADYPELENIINQLNLTPKNLDAPRLITIPAFLNHAGEHSHTIKVDWVCIKCGGTRGPLRWGRSYDGSQFLNVNVWTNPCGHIETYEELRDHYADLINSDTLVEA